MGNTDLTTAIVVGAVVGLFFVALGHAQVVWIARRRRARDPGGPELPSPARTLLSWAAALIAALCFLRAATSRALPDRPGVLVAEDLFTVRPRPGLVAMHQTQKPDVRRGEPLVRFTGQDGREAKLAIRDRRQQLSVQLANERMRPLDFDAETMRRADAARSALREHEQRLNQLVSERDAIMREGTSQRLALESRRFRIEQEERDSARELEPLLASVKTEKDALRSAEQLLANGFVSRMEVARERDSVRKLEARVHQLRDTRSLLTTEKAELASLRSLAETTLERQLQDRAAELGTQQKEIEAARAPLQLATEALEQDRPRAVAERQKRLRELESELKEWDALLDGRAPQLLVEAPWDGRVGFREPLPRGVPTDGGPLLVMYRAGKIWAAVRLDPGEAEQTGGRLNAAMLVQAATFERGAFDGAGRHPESLLDGTVVQRAVLADGATELHVACDPPDRVVRELAMAGSVPVLAQLSRPLTSIPSFRLGLGLAALALGLAVYGPLRRRAGHAVAGRAGSAYRRTHNEAGPRLSGRPPNTTSRPESLAPDTAALHAEYIDPAQGALVDAELDAEHPPGMKPGGIASARGV